MKRIFTSLVMVLAFAMQGHAQLQTMNSACEQNPCQALPICATTVINPYSYQSNTGNLGLNATCVNAIGPTTGYAQNWMYYRFTCQTAGTLNFTITPNDPLGDLDWALWNITNSGCGGIAPGNLVECNTAVGVGGTGMQAAAVAGFEPAQNLIAGNTYILGVSRRSGGTSNTAPVGPPYVNGSAGFSINFAGTANIINNSAPALLSVLPYDPCLPVTQLKLRLTQPVRCFQIGAADFSITGGGPVPSFTASGGIPCPGCVSPGGFNFSNATDTIVLNFSSAIPAGSYTISLVGINPFGSLCGTPANTAITLPLTVSANLNNALTVGFNCAALTYSATLQGQNGLSPYQYKAQGPGQTNTYGTATPGTNVFTGLTGGSTYTFTVRDATGCTRDTVFTPAPYIPLTITTFKKDPPCTNQFAQDTFRVVNTNGGGAPFTYALTSTPASASATAIQYAPGAWNNLQQGNFTITATDVWGCTATAVANIANPPVVTFPTPTSTNPQCFGDSTGAITVNASGGTGAISYTINPNPPTVVLPAPGFFTQVISGLPGLTSPGITYTITASDINGCTATNTRVLTTPTAITINTSPATIVNPTCTNPCGGTYSPIATGGTGFKRFYRLPLVTPPNTYTDSVVVTGGSFQNLCQGTYTVRGVDVLGCATTVTITLTLPPIPDIVNNSVTNVTCFGLCNGQILNTTTGGTTPYTYSITPSNNPPCGNAVLIANSGGDYQNLPAGTYKIVVTSPNQCKDSIENIVITQPAAIVWNSVTPTNLLCFGNNNGTIAVNATGGTGTIQYTITPLGPQLNTTGNFTGLTAQQYTITATDASGCSTTTTALITQPADLLFTSASFVAPTCNGLSNGTITVATTGGTPNVTFTISGPTGPNPNQTGIFSGLAAGPYTITATDGNGCTETTIVTVTQPGPIVVTSATFVSPLCFGNSNGSITVVTTGGVNPKTYSINPAVQPSNSTGVFTGLSAQSYVVTITDDNTCSTTTTVNVVQPTAVSFLSASFTPPACGGDSNATITTSATGGTGTKTYSINPALKPSNTTGLFTGLPALTYTITATDVNGCTSTSSITITQPTPLVINTATFTQPLCFNGNTASISVSAVGGTGQKTYSILPAVQSPNTTGIFNGLSSQAYTVTATDNNGCSSSTIINITQPTQLTIASASFVQPSCFAGANGTISMSASGGTPNYTFTISPLGPQSNQTGNFNNLTAQCYTVTATDQNGCISVSTVCITQPTAVVATVTGTTSPSCSPGCDGSITVSATGGTGTKTYSHPTLPQSPAATFNNVCATISYTITATDQNGCTGTTSTTLAVPSSPSPVAAVVTNVSCNGQCNGTAQVTIVPGITYTIAPTNPGQNFNTTTGAITGLCAGTYTITATNALACSGTTSFTISQPTVLTLAINTVTNPTCVPNCNGTATVTSTGGTGSKTYSIAPSGSINATTGNASNLCAGITYTITVTDVNGCTSTTSITPATPVSPTFTSATFTAPLCNGNSNGTITVVATGLGQPTYTITPSGPQSNTTGIFNNIAAGTYTITATTPNGCTAQTVVIVTQPNALTVTSATFTQPSCFGLNDGTATVVATGGTNTLTYTITPLGPQSNTTGNFNNLTAQCYTVTVTDANNCTATTTFCVTQPAAVVATITGTTSPTCTPGCDGTITVSASGGTAGYTYASTLSQSPVGTFVNACAATAYVITATDANGCTGSTSTTLSTPNAPTPAAVAVNNVSCNGQCNGTAQVTIVPGITYTLAPTNPGQNFNTTTGAITGLCAGTYTVTATNALSCVGTVSFTITAPPVLTLAINTVTDPTCVPSNNGTATVTTTGGSGSNVFTIAPSGTINASTGNASNLAPGTTYTITVTDVNGCTSTTTVIPATPVSPTFTSATFTAPLCNGNSNGTITVVATGLGQPTYTITPSGPQSNTTGIFNNIAAGTYTITATTPNGCTAQTVVVVTQPNALTVTSATFTQPTCFGLNDGTATVVATGGTNTLTYTITPLGPQSNITGNFNNLTAQCYTVTVTDVNNCVANTTFCVTQPAAVVATITGTTSPTCTPGCDGSISVTGSGGTAPITFTSNPFLTQSPAGTFINACAATAYVITASDANGCTGSTSTTLSTPNAPTPAAVAVNNVSCNGQCNGTAQVTIVPGITYTLAPTNPGQNFNTTTGAITGLCAGTYTVTATNALSCVGTVSFTITEPTVLTLAINTVTDPTCVPSNNGTATVTTTGGSGSNVFTIAPSGTINASTGNATNLAPGTTYTITVTDVNGCTSQTTILPATPVSPSFSSPTFTSPLCNGGTNGTITVVATGLGQPTYTITPSGPQSNTTGIFNNIAAGTYTVTATTPNGCTAQTVVIVTQPNALTVTSATFTQPTCFGLNDGTATVVATGGTNTLTYTITPLGPQSNITGNFNNLTAQCYTVTVTDVNNCVANTTFCVTQPNAVVVNITNTTLPSCTPGCDGSIVVTTSGGTAPIGLVSNPFLAQSPAGTFINACAAVNYVITASDANGCSASTSTTLTTPNAPTPSAVAVNNVSCNGQCNGTAQVTIVPGITYTIAPTNPGQNFNTTTGAITGLCAGTYVVTATNALSCVGTVSFTITEPTVLTLAINTVTDPTCVPSNNGTATVTTTGGSGSNVFTIVPSGTINASTGNATNLAPGTTYIITVTDVNGCTSTTTVTPATPVSPTFTSATFTAPLCNGGTNGTITVVATGLGQPTYTITPSGPQSNTTGIFNNIAAGTYTITATTPNGCTAQTVVIVTQPNALTVTSATFTQPTCFGLNDGTATVVATGGTNTLTYTITPLGPQSNITGNFNNLTAQCYTVTVTDVNNCVANTTFCITQPSAVVVNITNTTLPSCTPGCDGSIVVTTSGGTAPIGLVSNPFLAQSPAGTFINACAAVNYVITASDANGCSASTSTTLTTPNAPTPAITGTVNVTCNGICDGTAQLTIVPGITYTITPSNPGQNFNTTTGAITGLCAGTYTVTATNALSCVGTVSFTITQPSPIVLNISAIVNPSTPLVCDGSAQANGSGGTAPLTYTITGPGVINPTTGAISALCDGCYTVTATDGNNCSVTTSFCVGSVVATLTASVSNIANATCFNTCNGTAQAGAVGGVLPYTYSIAPTVPSGAINPATGAITGLCAGTVYIVTVTDAVNATTTVTVTVTQPTQLNLGIVSTTNASCIPGCDGTAVVSANGGSAGYSYAVNPSAGIIQNPAGTFSGLCVGTTYSITVTDLNGCTSQVTVNITTPGSPTPVVNVQSNVTCFGLCNGTAQIVTVPGVTYTIAGPGSPVINAGNITALCAGTYVVTATSAGQCTGTVSFTITQPTQLTLALTNTTNPSCVPGCDGTASVTASGGIGGNTFSISPSGTINALGNATNLCANIVYTITVTNGNNCSAQTTVTLTTPGSPTVTIANTTIPTCVPGCDGTATPIPQAGLTYSISPAATINTSTGAASGLCAGVTYTITATDVNGCTGQTTVNLTAPVATPISIVSTTPPTCVPGCDGTATPTAVAGAVYTIAPSGTINSGTGVASNLCAGITYTITATTANGCFATTTVLLNAPANPTVNVTGLTNPSGPVNCDGTGTANGGGGLAPYTYAIAGAGSPVINPTTGAMSNLCGSCYTITVTDANGCTGTTSVCLTNPLIVTAVGNNATCFGQCNGTGQATAQGGSQSGYTYAINGGASINATTGAITNLCAGTLYVITVTDANSTTATTTLQISGPTQITFNAATTVSPSCNPGCDGNITISANGGTPGYTYSISSPVGSTCTPVQNTPGNFGNVGTGTYTITVTDANNCTSVSTVTVLPLAGPSINNIVVTNPLCNNDCNGTITTNATGATGITLLPQNITNATGNFTNLCGGAYTVVASDANGCTAASTVNLVNPSAVTVVTATSTNVNCNGQSTGTITFNVTGGTGAITYTASPALTGSNGNYTSVAAGTYTITAADVNNCSVSQVFTITQPTALSITSVSVASPLCSNQSNGVITLNVTGGTGLYTATTNPTSAGAGPSGSPLTINGLAPTTYQVTIADANNCTVTSSVTVPGSVPIVVNSINVTQPTCNANCDGIITVAATGGNGILTYTINPSGPASNTTGIFNSLCGGSYTVTVTDVNACTQTATATVITPTVISFTSVSSTNPLCFGNNNGTITVAATGGTGLVVYSITPASNQPTPGNFTGLIAGTYTVFATDANNCSISTVITLTNPAQLVWNNPTFTNVSCSGGSNGTITAPATGGTGTLTYSINPAVQASNTTGSFVNLSAQCYTVTVADIQGCNLTTVICITEPTPLAFSQPTVVNVLCFGAATGSISISASGGTPNYTYSLSPNNGTQTSPGVFDNLVAGAYAVTVTDANGCTSSTANILISQPPAITFTSVSVQDVACFGDATGSISVTAQGGVGNIQFSLQPAGNQATPGFFSGLLAGSYTVSATDANNCVVTSVVTVGSNPQLVLNSVTLTEPICFGDNNGAIAATAVGGVAPIQFSLNNSPFQNNGSFNNLYAGYYIMTLRDAIGCLEDTLINLTQPTEVGATVQLTAANCVDSKDGKAIITGTGGRGGYKYYLSPGLYINKSGVFGGLAIGTYTLRVVDTAGCEYRNVFTINPPANPLNNFMTKQDLGCYGRGNEGQATANVQGGTPPYTFMWNTSPVQTTATASTLYFGLYKLQITDANGCQIKDSVYIEEGPCCDVAFIPNAFSPNGDGNNDEFRILTSAGVELQQLEIYNRWGQRVWSSNNVHRSWNGYIDGQEAPMDTYYYILRYTCTRDRETYTKKGDVILVR